MQWTWILRWSLDVAPGQAERRETLIDEAWAGLPGWRT